MDTPVINTKLPIGVVSKGENMALLRYEATVLGATRNLLDDDFKAQALWYVQ